jgi:hypothetical protein
MVATGICVNQGAARGVATEDASADSYNNYRLALLAHVAAATDGTAPIPSFFGDFFGKMGRFADVGIAMLFAG